MSAGRPTKYNDDMPEMVIQCMNAGMSVSQFAALMAVSRATVYNWIRDHEAFAEAVEVGRTAFEAYWETRLQKAMHDRTANAALYKMWFAARLGWSERTTMDLKSSDRSMTPQPALDVSKLSTGALEELLEAYDAADDVESTTR